MRVNIISVGTRKVFQLNFQRRTPTSRYYSNMSSEKGKYFFSKENAKVMSITEPMNESRTLYTCIDHEISKNLEMGIERVEPGTQVNIISIPLFTIVLDPSPFSSK